MEDRRQKILLLIRERFLVFLYENLFKINKFSVLKVQSGLEMRQALQKNDFNLIVLAMRLDEKDLKFLIEQAVSKKIPILFLNIDTTKDFLGAYLKYDQYAYVDILSDDPKMIIEKARKLMARYSVKGV